MYAIASKTGITVHFIGVNGFTLCGRVIRDTTDSMAGMKLCVRCNLAEQRTNPILAMIGNREVEDAPITDVAVGDVVEWNGHPVEVMSVDGDTAHVSGLSSHVTYGAFRSEITTDVSAETVAQFNTDCVVLAYSTNATSADMNRAARALGRMRGMGAINAGQRAELMNEIEHSLMREVLTVSVSDSKAETVTPVMPFPSELITMARNAIKALTPIRDAAYSAFIAARDSGKDEYVTGWAYQMFADTRNAIEEYERTISSITPEHFCNMHYSEIGLTEECAYGCKIYRCSKCQDERTLHNATYGCQYPA